MKNSVVRCAARKIRQLAIELLEARTYLASDIIHIASQNDPSASFTTSILRDPNTNTLAFANPSLQFVVSSDATSAPPIFESFKLIDPELTIVVKRGNDVYQDYRLQSSRGDTWASVDIRPNTGFTTGQVLVGIRRVSDPDSAPWLATQLIEVTVLKENPAVDLSLTATTPDGASLDALHVGDDFILHVWAQDARTDPHGVFAAYMNLNWDGMLAEVNGQPTHGEHFFNGQSGFADAPGSLSRIGGFGGAAETKGNRYEVFSVPMHARAAGDFLISSGAIRDGSPAFNILEYGIDSPINTSAVQFGKLSIHIAGGAGDQTHRDKPENPVKDKPIQQPPAAPINQQLDMPAMALSLSATTIDGKPINELHAGENFVLHVWAQDTRPDALGVFAAYLNLNWDSRLASLNGGTVHGEQFSNGIDDGDAEAGSLSHIGGFGGMKQTMAGRYEVFSVPMQAIAAGDLAISSSPDPYSPVHNILEYAIDTPIPFSAVQFGKLTIHVAGASPSQSSPIAASGQTLDPQPTSAISTSTIQQAAIPAIIVTGPANSRACPIAVNIKDLLSPELRAAIAGRTSGSSLQDTDNGSSDLASAAKLDLSIL